MGLYAQAKDFSTVLTKELDLIVVSACCRWHTTGHTCCAHEECNSRVRHTKKSNAS